MLPWFLQDPLRLELEKKRIEDLAESSDWLEAHAWTLDKAGLQVTAIFDVSGRKVTLRLTYPTTYPFAPPVVQPIGEEGRLTAHQYGGPEGPLCLEWGPDNWHPELTGADMLVSGHKLLMLEAPADDGGERLPAPSRHQLTLGQELRSELVRWYCHQTLITFLKSERNLNQGSFDYSLRSLDKKWLCLVHELGGDTDAAEWKDSTIPANLPGASPACRSKGQWFRTEVSHKAIKGISAVGDFRSIGVPTPDAVTTAVLLLDSALEPHLILIHDDDTLSHTRSFGSQPEGEELRAPVAPVLNTRDIAVVGLGSVGSKLALSLARMGTPSLYLVDPDVLLPENLHRHALDWQGVGFHKVDAARRALELINPQAVVTTSRVHLTGQESNEAINLVLQRIAACDLIVDATASPAVFNLLASIAEYAGVPLCWVEVYGAGVGGMVGRARPELDPRPHDIRATYHAFCENNPAPPELVAAVDYVASSADDPPLAASDADVTFLAHFAVKLAVDSLLPGAESEFLESVYLVGLKRSWIFDEAPVIIPLSTGSLPRSKRPQASPAISDELKEFLINLLDGEGESP